MKFNGVSASIVRFSLVLAVSFLDACVDRLFLDFQPQKISQLVVDGSISDQAGPYQIRLFRSSGIEDDLRFGAPFRAKEVTISDDVGKVEILTETGPGIYETDSSGFRGKVGRSYQLRILELDGNIIESSFEALNPISEIDSIYYKFESFEPTSGPTEYGFRILIDSRSGDNDSKYLRWRFTGSYVSTSYPQFRKTPNCGRPTGPPSPPPCSGFVWTGTILKNVGPCTCCDCWVTDNENEPKLNDNQISTSGIYEGIEVGFVPFNQWTFAKNKYMVVVEQMSLTRESYDYWKTIKDQKEGATSLFQPAFGRLNTNMQSVNSDRKIFGFFHASSVKKKTIFLTGKDAPFSRSEFAISPPEGNCTLWEACNILFVNASTSPPPEWR